MVRRSTIVSIARRTIADPIWKLEDAKARFSEVVRRAQEDGPQYVTRRGRRAVAIIDADELDRLRSPVGPSLALVPFLESLYVGPLDLERDRDPGRDGDL